MSQFMKSNGKKIMKTVISHQISSLNFIYLHKISFRAAVSYKKPTSLLKLHFLISPLHIIVFCLFVCFF